MLKKAHLHTTASYREEKSSEAVKGRGVIKSKLDSSVLRSCSFQGNVSGDARMPATSGPSVMQKNKL